MDDPVPTTAPTGRPRLAVAQLFVYPLKSARGFSPAAWPVDGLGLAWDRHWLVARPDGAVLTQREEPRLALLESALGAGCLAIAAPSGPVLEVPLEPPADPEPCDVRIFGAPVTGALVSPDADAWLSRFLGYPARLVRVHDERRVNAKYAVSDRDRTGFADAFPILVIGAGSLADLNARLERPVPADRFRPNIVIAGAPAWAEDGWRRIRAGELELALVKPCARCVIVTTDQQTGARGAEPLRTLATYRRAGRDRILFGQNAIQLGTGLLRAGDPVTVLDPAGK